MKQQHAVQSVGVRRRSRDIDFNKGAVHELIANPNNVHWGYFSAAIQPALTIKWGEIVVIEDVPRVDPEIVERSKVVHPGKITENHRAIYREVKDRGTGPHIMVGPVYVNCAEPWMSLRCVFWMFVLLIATATTPSAPIRAHYLKSFPGFGSG